MNQKDITWLASYPRSGNTYLRTLLWHCFGLRSASFYPNDLGGNKALENYTGHIEHGPQLETLLYESGVPLMKTHELCQDDNRAIYIIRDGRAACVSLWKFYHGQLPLDAVIEGNHRFGTWAAHVESWHPSNRPNTLLLRYEDLRDNQAKALQAIGEFLNRDIISNKIPSRETVADVDGRWVRKKTNWKADLFGKQLQRFVQINKDMLRQYDYL